MNPLVRLLPFRIQSKLGYRPDGEISSKDFFNNAKYNITKKHLAPNINRITLPIHVEEVLPPDYSAVTIERVREFCSDYFCAALDNATLLDVHNLITIVKDNKVILPLSIPPVKKSVHLARSIPSYPKKKKLAGTTIALSTTGAKDNYFHYLVELAQKIGFAESCGYPLAAADHILINKTNFGFQKAIMELFNVPQDKVVETQLDSCVECEKLIVPSFTQHSYFGYTYVRDTILSKADLTPDPDSPRLIYCGRRNTGLGRSVTNDQELSQFLISKGFTVLYFEDYSIPEQARLVYNAEMVVSPHGAGMANLLFARPETQVIEFNNIHAVNLTFYPYALYAGLAYATLICESTDNPARAEHMKDIIVDIPKLAKLLVKMGK